MRAMHPIAVAGAVVAALIHLWFFAMESLWFMRPSVWRRFGIASEADAGLVRSWAFNQGFYNLFLAVAVAAGLALVATGQPEAGRAIVLSACASMMAAGVVLFLHNPKFLRAAALQFVPALVAVVGIIVLR